MLLTRMYLAVCSPESVNIFELLTSFFTPPTSPSPSPSPSSNLAPMELLHADARSDYLLLWQISWLTTRGGRWGRSPIKILKYITIC